MLKKIIYLSTLPALVGLATVIYSCQKTAVEPKFELSESAFQKAESREYIGECTGGCTQNGTIEVLDIYPANALFFMDVLGTAQCSTGTPPEAPYCGVGSFSNVCPTPPGSGAVCLQPGFLVPIRWIPGKKYWFSNYNLVPSHITIRVRFGTTSQTYRLSSENLVTGPFVVPNCNGTVTACDGLPSQG